MKKKILIFILVLASIGAVIFYLQKTKPKQAVEPPINQKVESPKAPISDSELRKEIGQMIMVGFRGTSAGENSDIYKMIKESKIGGVVLFDFDVASNSYPRNIASRAQVKNLISEIQSYSDTPLFVSVDAEGGNVNRLKTKYGFMQIVSEEKMGKDSTLLTTRSESTKLADELQDVGFNMNLAPVVDVNINPKNPIIGSLGRSFSANPSAVFSNAQAFIRGHLTDNIIPVEKHFPGQGSATVDSHIGITDITNTYKESELSPYKKLNDAGLLDVVMVGHVMNKNIDPIYPATLSPNFLQNILRKEIGFQGVIISDDMQMGAITKNYGFEDSIIRAVNAGNDIISVVNNTKDGYDKNLAGKVSDLIFNAVREKKIDENKITNSYNRIMSLKKKFRIVQPSPDEIKSEKFELLSSTDSITFGMALDIANSVSQKIEIRPAFLLGISQEELTLEKTDMCYLTDFKKGSGVRITDGTKLDRVMKPDRDVAGFLSLTKELGLDPLKAPVTCPMSFGWGGAMGSLDFIPSTWLTYKSKLEKITGKPSSPWSTDDAFLMAGMYLSESGAKSKEEKGEHDAGMIYFSGSTTSLYTWYADGALKIASKIQKDIGIISH